MSELKKQKEPLISIVIPTYNRSEYLERCLKSILSQQDDCYEVIISDNASPDATQEIIEKYLVDERIHYYRNEQNLGFRENVYKATGYAQGQYIFWLTDDDYLLPNALSKVCSIINQYPYVGYFFSPLISVDDRSGDVFSEIIFSNKDEFINPSIRSTFAISKVTNVFSRQILKRDYIDWKIWQKFINNAYPSIILAGRILSKFPSYYISEQLVVHTWYNVIYWDEFGKDEIEVAITTSHDYKNSAIHIFHDCENTKELSEEYLRWKLNALNDYLCKPSGFFQLVKSQGQIRSLLIFIKKYQPDLTEIAYLINYLAQIKLRNLKKKLRSYFNKLLIK